jgi:hypothetical protein
MSREGSRFPAASIEQAFLIRRVFALLGGGDPLDPISPRNRRVRPSFSWDKCYISCVSAAEIIDQLPKLNETERRAILEKLRELAHQDDEQWERIIADPRPRPKLEAFVKEALREGSEPLNLERL